MSKREAIIELHCAGKTNSQIMDLLKVAKSTVYYAVKRFKELGTSKDRPRSGKPRSVRTKKVIKVVRERVRRNPKRSIRTLAKDLQISKSSMQTIVKRNIKLFSFKMRKCQELTTLQKQKRLDRSKIILNILKSGTKNEEIIFSDKKLFTVEAKFNRHNDRVYAKNSANIPDSFRTVYRRQKPLSVMVWAAISKTWKSPLIFVKPGVKIISDFYINEILIPAAKDMKRHFKNNVYTFQQDGAPSHTSKKSQEWYKREFPKFWNKEIWPPASPDLNPMDFFVWSMLEAKACSVSHKSIADLKKSLKREWANIPQEKLRACAEGFRGRIEAVIRMKGGHFEV